MEEKSVRGGMDREFAIHPAVKHSPVPMKEVAGLLINSRQGKAGPHSMFLSGAAEALKIF